MSIAIFLSGKDLNYSCLWYKGRECKDFQFLIGYVKFIVAHSIPVRSVWLLVRLNALGILKTTPVLKMRKHFFLVLVQFTKHILGNSHVTFSNMHSHLSFSLSWTKNGTKQPQYNVVSSHIFKYKSCRANFVAMPATSTYHLDIWLFNRMYFP